MLVKNCERCKYGKINQEIKDIYMYINHDDTPWFNICKIKKENEKYNEIYCMTSALDLNLDQAIKTYEIYIQENQKETNDRK